MNECTKKVRVITLASYTDNLKILLLWSFCTLILLQNEE